MIRSSVNYIRERDIVALMIESGQYDKALAELKKRIQNNPNDYYNYLAIGRLYSKIGNIDASIWYFKLLLHTSFDERAKLELGHLYARLEEAAAKGYLLSLMNTPLRSRALSELGKYYTKINDFEMASKCFQTDFEETNSAYALKDLILLNIKKEEYDLAYFYLYELTKKNVVIDKDLENLMFYLSYKIGVLSKNVKPSTYFQKQTVEYNESNAIYHIKENYYGSKKSYFTKNCNINDLYYEILDIIQNMEPDEVNTASIYYVNLNRIIGICDDDVTSTLKVVCLPNTTKILSMYPIHCNYLMSERKVNRKVKVIV